MAKIFVSAGESSGDLFASLLVRHVLSLRPGLEFCGIGGKNLAREGVKLLARSEELAVVGLWEVARRLPAVLRAFGRAKEALKDVDAVVLVDFPGFNLKLAGVAKRLGLPVFYYIAPQVWAWGASRMGQIAERVTKMAVVLPFEEPLFRKFGVDATFVGHPLLDVVKFHRSNLRDELGIEGSLVGLLPGSRTDEVRRHLPLFLEALDILGSKLPGTRGVVAAAEGVPKGTFRTAEGKGTPVLWGRTYEVISSCDLVLVASGTATLEATLLETPMVVVYRTSWASYSVACRLVKVPHIALPNLVAGRPVVPELIQSSASPESIAEEALKVLKDGGKRMRSELRTVREKLGEPGASERAAEHLLDMLDGPNFPRRPAGRL